MTAAEFNSPWREPSVRKDLMSATKPVTNTSCFTDNFPYGRKPENSGKHTTFSRELKPFSHIWSPKQLLGIFKLRSTLRNRELRDKTMLHLPKVNSKMGQTMFEYAGAKDWNSLPINIREITSINIFKETLFTYLLDCDVNSHNCSL